MLILAGASLTWAAPQQYESAAEYHQYVNVPSADENHFQFYRGSPHHRISRVESYKDGNFRTKV